MRPLMIFAALAVGSTAACAPTAGAPALEGPRQARECFFASEVRSFASTDSRSVYVRVSQNQVFELRTIGCNNTDWAREIAIVPRGGGSSICSGMDAELLVPDLGAGRQTCPVTGVRRLTEAEVSALDSRAQP